MAVAAGLIAEATDVDLKDFQLSTLQGR